MENQNLIPIVGILILIHFFVNAALSKEIIDWVPSLKKQILMIVFVWGIPLLGAIFAYKYLCLTWFKKADKKSSGTANVSGGLLGMDSFVNPGAKHLAALMQKQHVETSEEGEMVDRDVLKYDIKIQKFKN